MLARFGFAFVIVTALCTAAHAESAPAWKKQAWIQRTEDTIRQKLKDPDSAKFRNAAFVRFHNAPLVCGEVNSKNGFGGFTGYQHFIGGGQTMAFLEEDFAPGEFAKVWNKICAS